MEIDAFINTSFIKRAVPFGVALFLFASCSTTRVKIQVLHPPEEEVVVPGPRIGVADRVDYNHSLARYYNNGIPVQMQDNYNPTLGLVVMDELVQDLAVGEVYNPVRLGQGVFPHTGEFYGALIPLNQLQNACIQNGIDALLVLEGMDGDIDNDGQAIYSAPVDRNYGTVQVPMFEGSQTVKYRLFFRLYDCSNGVKIHEREEEAQNSSRISGSSPREVDRRMPQSNGMRNQVVQEAAARYVSTIAPHYVLEERKIFVSGNAQFSRAKQLVENGDWQSASDIWYQLATSSNSKVAGKASFNLAVASEYLGKYKLAIEWAQKCVSDYRMNSAVGYLNLLKDRNSRLDQINR